MVVLVWMAGSQSLKKTVQNLSKEEILELSVGTGRALRYRKGIFYVG